MRATLYVFDDPVGTANWNGKHFVFEGPDPKFMEFLLQDVADRTGLRGDELLRAWESLLISPSKSLRLED